MIMTSPYICYLQIFPVLLKPAMSSMLKLSSKCLKGKINISPLSSFPTGLLHKTLVKGIMDFQ